jgi:hypothetical protein
VDAVQETTVLEWLFKHGLKARAWCLPAQTVVGSGRDENSRIADLALPELSDEFDPVHSSHGVVNHQASVPRQVGLRQDLGRPLVEAHGQAFELKGEFQ